MSKIGILTSTDGSFRVAEQPPTNEDSGVVSAIALFANHRAQDRAHYGRERKCSNASLKLPRVLQKGEVADFGKQRMFDLNLNSVFHILGAAIPLLRICERCVQRGA